MQADSGQEQEEALLLKLFRNYHLNVEERRRLPNGKIRASIVRAIVKQALIKNEVFPHGKLTPEGNAGGEYIQIEGKKGKANIHINYESSYLQYSHTVRSYDSVQESADAFLVEKQSRNDLDGVEIDWDVSAN